MYCLQSRPYIFQPGNFTGLGSEGVKPHRVRRGKRRDRGEISALIKLPKAVGGCRNYTLFCRLFLTSFVVVFLFVCLLFCFVCLCFVFVWFGFVCVLFLFYFFLGGGGGGSFRF